MAHIASCLSPNKSPDLDMHVRDPPYSQTCTDFPIESSYSDLVRRANRWKQSSSSKYLLWPYQPKSPTTPPGEPPSDAKVMALSVARSATSLSDTTSRDPASSQDAAFTLRPKAGSFSRRRKPGVTELGSMATVQETATAVDSPTIPGRPPVRKLTKYPRDPSQGHGRSSSAPGSGWRNNPFGDAMISCVTGPPAMSMQRIPEGQSSSGSPAKKKTSPTNVFKPTQLEPVASPARPGPKDARPQLQIRTNTERVESPEGTPPIPPPKSAPIRERSSPASNRPTPVRKSSSKAFTHTASPSQQPTERASAESLDSKASDSKASTQQPTASAIPAIHKRQQSDTAAFGSNPTTDSFANRGRPIKRAQSFSNLQRNASVSSSSLSSSPPKEVWKLPNGLRKNDADLRLSENDKQKLQRQAVCQAEKFEVLSEKDIATLSKELRALDERCDYLRKTYRSLRGGRQKLHARMMSYLKRENGIIFTREGLIRQEEALAELDLSLDDWISKIEQAENRRLRIRQKVLEHFCVAMTLGQGCQEQTPPRSPVERTVYSPKLETTIAATTAMMTATEPELRPLMVESPKVGGDPEKRRDVQSIKIYADGNVLDLFSDIEQAIDNMFDYDEKKTPTSTGIEQLEASMDSNGKGRNGSTATQ